MKRKKPDADKVKKLTEYFKKHDNVVMAFLFGSRAGGQVRKISDWDIGIYLREQNRIKEREIWLETERILGGETDLVVLNRASATIAWQIIGRGEPLTIKNRDLYWDFLFMVSDEANAFYQTSERYYQIFQRSASLSAIDQKRLNRIIMFLEEEVKDYPKFRKLTWEEYNSDRAKKREVEHWIEHLVIAVVDTAEIVLASERRALPETYAELVLTLASVGTFRGELSKKITHWVILRNILAHEYLDFRWKNISEFILETESLWNEFINRAKKYLNNATLVSH